MRSKLFYYHSQTLMKLPRSFTVTSIVLSIFFVATVLLPSFFQRLDRRFPFQGVEIMGADAEVHYAARIREGYDGFWLLGNTFYSLPKQQSGLMSMIPETPIGLIARSMHIDAVSAFLLSKVILSISVCLLFIVFVFSLTRHRGIALATTAVLLFAGALLAAPWNISAFFLPSAPQFDFIRFARAINPQWSVTWALVSLIGIAEWMRRPRRFLIFIAASAFAITVYSYVYAWTFLAAIIGLVTAWYIVKRDQRRFYDLLLFWGVALVLSTPYFIYLRSTLTHPFYEESAMRLGMLSSHQPIFGIWMFIFLGVSLLSKKMWPAIWPLPLAMAIGGVIAINQQVFTGHFIVPHHYHWYFIQPFSAICTVALFLEYSRRFFSRFFGAFLTFIVLLSVFFGIRQQTLAYQNVREEWGKAQKYAPILAYVEEHFMQGEVLYSQDIFLSDLIPVYTSADVYDATNATGYLVSEARVREVYFFTVWLQGLTPEQVAIEFFGARRYELSRHLYGIYYRELDHYAALPDELVQKHVDAYRQYYALSTDEKLRLWPLTAVISTPRDTFSRQWQELLSRGKEVFSYEKYTIITL